MAGWPAWRHSHHGGQKSRSRKSGFHGLPVRIGCGASCARLVSWARLRRGRGSRHAARAAVAQGELRGHDLPVGGAGRPYPPEPESARRGAGRRLSQADAPRRADPGSPQPRLPPPGHGRGHGGVPRRPRRDSRSAGVGVRLRAAVEQRLARRQSVHGGREQPRAPPRHRAVRQRPAARRRRTQEPGGRGRDPAQCLAAAPDLPGGAALAVHLQCGARRIGRRRGPARHPHRRVGMVQAWRTISGEELAPVFLTPTPGGDRGGVREAALSCPSSRLHRVRG